MATLYFGVPAGGDTEGDVTKATSTTSAAIELVVDNAATNMSHLALVNALKALLMKVEGDPGALN